MHWEDTPSRRIRHAVKNSNADEVKDFIVVAVCFVDLKSRDCGDPLDIIAGDEMDSRRQLS